MKQEGTNGGSWEGEHSAFSSECLGCGVRGLRLEAGGFLPVRFPQLPVQLDFFPCSFAGMDTANSLILKCLSIVFSSSPVYPRQRWIFRFVARVESISASPVNSAMDFAAADRSASLFSRHKSFRLRKLLSLHLRR